MTYCEPAMRVAFKMTIVLVVYMTRYVLSWHLTCLHSNFPALSLLACPFCFFLCHYCWLSILCAPLACPFCLGLCPSYLHSPRISCSPFVVAVHFSGPSSVLVQSSQQTLSGHNSRTNHFLAINFEIYISNISAKIF